MSKRYKVRLQRVLNYEVEVEAESPTEAEDQAIEEVEGNEAKPLTYNVEATVLGKPEEIK